MIFKLAFAALVAFTQNQPSPEAMKKMLEEMQPAAEHKSLAALVGRWTQDVTYSMGGPPMKTTGTVVNRMILGGRFLVSEGTSPNPSPTGPGDANVEFTSIYGFDRRTREFTIIVLDTMGTYYVTAAGAAPDPRNVVMRGETLEHDANARETRKYDMVLRVINEDTYVSEIIFHVPGRAPQTVVSVTHRRVK